MTNVCFLFLVGMDLSALEKVTTCEEVKAYMDANGDAIAEAKGPMTAAKIAEAFHPISPSGAIKCAKGMELVAKAESMAKSEMDKLDGENPDGMVEEIFAVLEPAPEAEHEELPDCEQVRATNTFDGIEFQSANGRCNNVNHPEWGAQEASLERLAKPDYDKGKESGVPIGNPATIRGGRLLPGARDISVTFHGDVANNDFDHSYLLMQWGQYLDHDVTLSPTTPNSNCDVPSKAVAANCFNIPIPSGDPQFDQGDIFQRKEIPLTRSAASDELNAFFTREQFNELTSFIDASNVYGSSQERQEQLRVSLDAGPGALLKTLEDGEGFEALPLNIPDFENEACMGKLPICLQAGDVRASEQPFLSFMHTLWVREHNRIVRILAKLNPSWGQDRLFHEARRIVASVNQHITFSEYLPNLIGGFLFKAIFKPYEGYDPTVNPGALNEFSHAAYRMGHSQLRNQLARLDENYKTLSEINFRQGFFQPARYFSCFEPDASYDNYFRGLLDRNSQQIDRFISEELNNHLFEEVDKKGQPSGPGLDLASLNIQRGRDHGLPGYLTILSQAFNFHKSKGLPIPSPLFLTNEFLKLVAIYGFNTLARVDLWVGGLSERAMETALPADKRDGGQLGPTFTYVISVQMLHFRDGDRYFHLNPNVNIFDPSKPPVPVLTPAQIESIQATSLATYICSTANNFNTMAVQPQAFRFPDSPLNSLTTPYPPGTSNQRLPCSKIIETEGSKCLDLSPWANDGKHNTHDDDDQFFIFLSRKGMR